MVNRAYCLDLVQRWDEGTGLCVMQGVNEQHTWARLDLFLMVLAKLYVRYLSAQHLRPWRTHLFCNKKIWLLHQDLKKQLEPMVQWNSTISLSKFGRSHFYLGRLQACVCQYVLGTNLLSLLPILSCGCPTTAFDFFTPCEGLRAVPAAAPSLFLAIQSNSCSLPWITCWKQGFGWPVTQTVKLQVGRNQAGEEWKISNSSSL